MIISENLSDGTIRHYSDMFYIRQVETGNEYEEAIDVSPCPYIYEETDKPLPNEPQITPEEALSIITGGDEV